MRTTRRICSCAAAALLGLLPDVSLAQNVTLFPSIEPHDTGTLTVSPTHTIHYAVSGNDDGLPVIALHGGPGGSSGSGIARLFDPALYRIVQFDQRGAGLSTPFAEWRDNDTGSLVADIDALRDHLGIGDEMVLFGLSWGTTLALAYAETHPERVSGLLLWGVFTCTKPEIDHIYHGGVAPFYPDVQADLRRVIPNPDKRTYPKQLFDVVTGNDEDAARRAITGFATYIAWLENIGSSFDTAREAARDPSSRSLAVLENYYLMNGCFLEEGELLANVERLRTVPTYIVNGRLDMLSPPRTAIRLARRLRTCKLEIVEGAGHVDLGVARAAVRGGKWIHRQVRR